MIAAQSVASDGNLNVYCRTSRQTLTFPCPRSVNNIFSSSKPSADQPSMEDTLLMSSEEEGSPREELGAGLISAAENLVSAAQDLKTLNSRIAEVKTTVEAHIKENRDQFTELGVLIDKCVKQSEGKAGELEAVSKNIVFEEGVMEKLERL